MEVVIFKIKKGAKSNFLRVHSILKQEIINSSPGYVSQSMLCSLDSPDTYIDLWIWQNEATARLAFKKFEGLESSGLFMEMIGSHVYSGHFGDIDELDSNRPMSV
jgi:hypothetical protein